MSFTRVVEKIVIFLLDYSNRHIHELPGNPHLHLWAAKISGILCHQDQGAPPRVDRCVPLFFCHLSNVWASLSYDDLMGCECSSVFQCILIYHEQ